MTHVLDSLGHDAWLTLFALCSGDQIAVVAGDPCAVVTDGRGKEVATVVLAPDVLDRLEAERLIDIFPAGAVPTARGRYWLKAWVKLNVKKVGAAR